MTRAYLDNVRLSGGASTWDEIEGKPDLQEKLVSGTNIKTVNNNTLLGEGDVHVEGGETHYATMDEVVNAINEIISERN